MSNHHLGTYSDAFESILAGMKKWERLATGKRLFVQGDEIFLREVAFRSGVAAQHGDERQHRLTGRIVHLVVTRVDYDKANSAKVHFRCLGLWTPQDEKEEEGHESASRDEAE